MDHVTYDICTDSQHKAIDAHDKRGNYDILAKQLVNIPNHPSCLRSGKISISIIIHSFTERVRASESPYHFIKITKKSRDAGCNENILRRASLCAEFFLDSRGD
jgi:hypothetical protein